MSSSTMASAAPREYFADFSTALRYWRGKRGYSQLQLSAHSTVSQRHLSFLESGRSQPSRDLILKLGLALDIPLRQRNVMLLAAGFAPAYQERQLSDPDMLAVSQALEFMLRQQCPFPALVVDRLWNLQLCNEAAADMMRWLLGMPENQPIPLHGAVNVLAMAMDPQGLRPWIDNWEDVAADMLTWIQREAMSDGPGSEAGGLLEQLMTLSGLGSGRREANLEQPSRPFLPFRVRKDGVALDLFTTIATLGTPRDVTLHELRVESFFPADAATEQWFRARHQP